MNAIQELKGAVYPVLCRAGLSGFSNELSQESRLADALFSDGLHRKRGRS